MMQMNVAGVRRNLKNIAHNYTDAQKKVREVTSNDPWGPSCALMAEIADLTYNVMAFSEIMNMIWKRLNDHGKNWRHVYKALVLLEYIIKTGSEKVQQQCKDNFYAIQTLKDFQYYEDMKDQGHNVREKAKALVTLLKDEEKLKNERTKALKAKERFAQSGTGFGSDGVVETITFTPPTSPSGRAEGGSWSGTPDMPESAAVSREMESARPQTVGEEELQLQLALAMSREEAEQEEQRRKSDDVRLQLALSQSQNELKPSSPPPGENKSHLLDLLDVNLGAAAPVPAHSPAADPWGMPKRPQIIDPWAGVSSSAVNPPPMDPWAANAAAARAAAPPDPWAPPRPSHSPALPAAADPWAPPRPVPADAWTPARVSPAPPQPPADPWGSLAPAPTPADPWSPTTDPSPLSPRDAIDEFDIISNRDRYSNNINNNGVKSPDAFDLSGLGDGLTDRSAKKSPHAFLGENSGLVNLENLVTAPKPSTAPQSAFVTNPFGGLGAPAPAAQNLFQQQGQQPGMAEYQATPVYQEQLPVVQLELEGNPNSLALRRPFDPVAHDLDASFRLHRFADLKGRGCKVPQEVLNKLLEGLQQDDNNPQEYEHAHFLQMETPRPTFGLGSSVTPLRHGGLCLVQTADILYPLVDDPYMMGKIACAHVLSGLYAMGVTECDNMLMLMSISTKMADKERDVVIPLIMTGFKDCALEAGSAVTGGQTVVNPWCSIGGVCSTVCQPNQYIVSPDNAVVGDVLVLTKPLGTQVAGNAHQWLDQPDRWNRIKLVVSDEDVRKAYHRAMDSMGRLNRIAARLMHKYNAHGATDVGGFGLLGHAQTLARQQKNEVAFVIHNLPVLAKMGAVAKCCGNMFQLLQGHSAETSGGLLICLPREQAAAYCKDIEKQEGYQAWIIGIVEKGNRTARIIDKPRVIEVPAQDKEGQLW